MDKAKRKRDNEENEDKEEKPKQAKVKGDTRPIVVDPEGKSTRYGIGSTLNDIRDQYDNAKVWLFSPTLDENIVAGASILQPSQTYEIQIPGKTVITPASDTKSKIRQQLNNIPSASTYGNPTHTNGFKASKNQDNIAVHRCNSGTPVVLLDPVLSELYDDLVNKAYIPTSQDCKAAKALMELLSEGFTDEVRDMQPKVKLWASQHMGWSLDPDPGKSDSRWLISSCLIMNIVMKREKGTGSVCSYMQNNGYYIKHWANHATDRIAECSNCPTILLEITGPEIAVNGGVLTKEGVLVDPFITTSLLCNVYDYNHLVAAARLVGAVTKAANKLKLYYERITDKPDVPSDGFPLFRSFPPTFIMGTRNPPLPNTKIELTYKYKLKDLLYVAEIKIGGDSKQVVVKFTHSYNVEAHQICFQNACAPMLYFAGETSRFKVIVMEYIPDAKQWDQVNNGEKKSAAMRLIVDTIDNLHSRNLVHGDLRSSNILLYGVDKVAIIDFDWSGPLTQVYPFFMNHTDLEWPDGAVDGQPLTKAHDKEWIRRSFV